MAAGRRCAEAETADERRLGRLGASMGDLLTKPHADGGFGLSRFVSSAVMAVFMMVCILLFPQRAEEHPGEIESKE